MQVREIYSDIHTFRTCPLRVLSIRLNLYRVHQNPKNLFNTLFKKNKCSYPAIYFRLAPSQSLLKLQNPGILIPQ